MRVRMRGPPHPAAGRSGRAGVMRRSPAGRPRRGVAPDRRRTKGRACAARLTNTTPPSAPRQMQQPENLANFRATVTIPQGFPLAQSRYAGGPGGFLVLCPRVKRPPKLDLDVYPYLSARHRRPDLGGQLHVPGITFGEPFLNDIAVMHYVNAVNDLTNDRQVMRARPVCKLISSMLPFQSAPTYPASEPCSPPRWSFARPGPHKSHGVAAPYFEPGFQDAVRLSGHLVHHLQTPWAARSRAGRSLSLRRRAGGSAVVVGAAAQHRPGDPGELRRQRHDDDVGMRARRSGRAARPRAASRCG